MEVSSVVLVGAFLTFLSSFFHSSLHWSNFCSYCRCLWLPSSVKPRDLIVRLSFGFSLVFVSRLMNLSSSAAVVSVATWDRSYREPQRNVRLFGKFNRFATLFLTLTSLFFKSDSILETVICTQAHLIEASTSSSSTLSHPPRRNTFDSESFFFRFRSFLVSSTSFLFFPHLRLFSLKRPETLAEISQFFHSFYRSLFSRQLLGFSFRSCRALFSSNGRRYVQRVISSPHNYYN